MKLICNAVVFASIVAALAGCETAPPDDGLLVQARGAIAQAEADPNVTKYAPTELDRARKLLINAEGAAKEKGATNVNTSHYAYLATQMAHIAEQRANEQVAVARLKAGEVERQKILLSARENETQQAQAVAAQARNELQNAQAASRPGAGRKRSASPRSSRTCRHPRPSAAWC